MKASSRLLLVLTLLLLSGCAMGCMERTDGRGLTACGGLS